MQQGWAACFLSFRFQISCRMCPALDTCAHLEFCLGKINRGSLYRQDDVCSSTKFLLLHFGMSQTPQMLRWPWRELQAEQGRDKERRAEAGGNKCWSCSSQSQPGMGFQGGEGICSHRRDWAGTEKAAGQNLGEQSPKVCDAESQGEAEEGLRTLQVLVWVLGLRKMGSCTFYIEN